ncbi:MAG: nuclear transport factor 2 family protein [Rhodoblastus sp.]|nr:nuclear transport factor 2 family protein [Rhodoblastus sp.]
MQTSSVSRQFADLDRALLEQRFATVLELCSKGDVAGVAAYFTPDVVYAGGTWRYYLLAQRREGREACAEMLQALYVTYESLGSTIDFLTVEGDCASLKRTTRLRHRGNGKVADVAICNFLRLRDGLICEYSEFPDTLAIAELDE